MENQPIISFAHFGFQYTAQAEPTLYDIDLTISKGEKVLIAGPSGCGKSTLAHCINGLIPNSYPGRSTGTLTVGGKDAKQMGLFDLSQVVGTVLQDSDGQFIGLTVAEDLAFALENDEMPQEEMKKLVSEIAQVVNVEKVLGNAPQEISGGQKQRVALGGVMVSGVDVLLFDEPLANLDPATGKKAVELIDEIQKKTGCAVIIIEHRLEDVLHRKVDRIVLMGEGRILYDGDPDTLLCTDLLPKSGIREPGQEEEKPELLNVEDLCFSYHPGRPVLKNISTSIRKGEMVSIVGTNGAGKSTFSKVLCGFETAQSGDLTLEGRDLSGLSIKERADLIGYVMQNPNQMISKPQIFDEVALGLRNRKVPEDQVKLRVEAALQTCGLYPFRNWPVSALSYGQKKRVTIASILVLEPEMILLDEPTAGQDLAHYTQIMDFLRELNQSGTTVVLITHDMHLMLEYTPRAIVFHDGAILADASAAQVLNSPDIVARANLKETSLYHLAALCGMDRPEEFTRRFIARDREGRRL